MGKFGLAVFTLVRCLWYYLAMNQAEQTQHLLSKLRDVFRDGYRPARGIEPYNVRLKNGELTYRIVNCLGHVFNLRNRQFNDYQIQAYDLYRNFPNIDHAPIHTVSRNLLDFIRETGLQVEACDPSARIDEFKSWKMALYFDNTVPTNRDFHFLLAEKPNVWSSKIGFTQHVERIYQDTPPQNYQQRAVFNRPMNYELYGTYKITNPNANPKNPYVKSYLAEHSR